MKKQPTKTALKLNRETVRKLNDAELTDVAGGFNLPSGRCSTSAYIQCNIE